MSALGTHEITAGIGMGLEPPLSPPMVQGPNAQMSQPDFSDLPTPPPAIRPPETALPTPDPAPAPEPEQSPEPLLPLQPVAQPAPVHSEPELPVVLPEPAPPAVAPQPTPAAEDAPVHDYFEASVPPPEPTPEPQPVEQAPPVETEQPPELEPTPLVAPAPVPAEPPAAELPPLMAPPSPEAAPEAEPAFIPETPVADIAPEPEQELPAAEVDLPFPESFPVLVPESAREPEPTLDPLARTRGLFRVVVRLRDVEGVEVGEFRDFGTAMEGAQEVIEQFATATETAWPFYAGRFIRPDLIVSVDVVEGEQD